MGEEELLQLLAFGLRAIASIIFVISVLVAISSYTFAKYNRSKALELEKDSQELKKAEEIFLKWRNK